MSEIICVKYIGNNKWQVLHHRRHPEEDQMFYKVFCEVWRHRTPNTILELINHKQPRKWQRTTKVSIKFLATQ